MSFRNLIKHGLHYLKEFFLLVFKKHPSLCERNSVAPFDKLINLVIARNIWKDSCCRIGNQELIYIHIPKCGGTSLGAAILNKRVYHKSAYTYHLSYPKRFASAVSFSVIRNPVDRFLSLMAHIKDGKMGRSSFIEGLQSLDITEIAFRYFDFPEFRKKLMDHARLVESGFTLSQRHWVSDNEKILVNRLFSLESMHLAEEWISSVFQKKISIPHLNQSSNYKKDISFDLERKIIEQYFEDWELWQKVTESGGLIVYR